MAVLYRKYRPQKLSEIFGQDEITTTLLKQLQSGKISHAYLFSGPRGTGKTSTARILAKALNCKNAKEDKFDEPCGKCDSCIAIVEGRYLDLLEIDAASNRGIDEIRELREKIRLAPTEGKFKVYIIDEVHMLTNEAFNALLKTLEEPPPHAIFILATTEPQKVPATILSRAQKFNFKRPSVEQITKKLSEINKQESLKVSVEALTEIAKASDGAFRDAEVLFDQVAATNPKAEPVEVRRILGKSEERVELIETLISGKTEKALVWLNNFLTAGGNLRLLAENVLEDLRALLLIKQGVGQELLTELTSEKFSDMETLAKKLSQEKIIKWVGLFTQALVDLRNASIPQLPLEMAIIEACGFPTEEEKEEQGFPKDPIKQEVVKTSETIEQVIETTDLKNEKVVKENQNLSAVKGGVGLDKVLEAWGTILKELKPKNNSLEIFLRSAKPKQLESGVLLIEFGYRFHKDRFEEPKNRAILEAILEEVLGEPVRIKNIVGQPPSKPIKVEETKEEVDPVEVFGKLD